MKFLRYLFGLMTFVTFSVYAQPAADLSHLLNALHTMRASFTQKVVDNHGKVLQQSSGQMSLERPGRFRWETKKPVPQVVVANGSKLWIYDPDLEQVTIRTLKHAAGETPALLLSDVNAVLDKDFGITQMEKGEQGWHWFTLTPKGKDNMFATIQLAFENGKVRQMKLQDHLGHATIIQFDHVESNMSLSPALFNFKPPKNADVINEAQQR